MHLPTCFPDRIFRRRGTLLLILALILGSCATENPQTTLTAPNPPQLPTAPPTPTPLAAPTPGAATALAIAPAGLTILVGASPVPLTARGRDDGGREVSLPAQPAWAVTPGTGTGTIDGDGRFTPGSAGSVTITATAGVLSASVPANIVTEPFSSLSIVLPSASPTPAPTATPTTGPSPTATPAPGASASPTSAPAALTVTSGTSVTLSAQGSRGATPILVTPTWTVAPTASALLDGNGVFRAFLSGTVTVSGSIPGATAQATIAIIPGPAITFAISGAAGTLSANTPVQLTASGRDSLNNIVTLPGVRWSIDPASTAQARVDSTGLLTPLAAGNITVRAEAGSLVATISLLLVPPVIHALTPFFARVGEVITVTGIGFGSSPGIVVSPCTGTPGAALPTAVPASTPLPPGVSTVIFTGDSNLPAPANEIVCWSDAQVQVRVPDTARPGPLAVRVGSTLSNTIPFVRLFGINAP